MSRIGFQKSMKVVPEVAVKLLWNLGISLSRRFMQQTTQLKETASLLQSTITTMQEGADGAASNSPIAALSQGATQLESTAQLGRMDTKDHVTTRTDPAAMWRKVQEAGFAEIKRVNSAPGAV